jgi:transcriptional regulator with XRE-family HTH domain
MGLREVLAGNLKRIRERAGLRQRDLAKSCGCAQGFISTLESGEFTPSVRTLEKLAAALGVAPVELLLSEESLSSHRWDGEGVPILNDRSPSSLDVPMVEENGVVGDSGRAFYAPGLQKRDAFAAYVPDDSMSPEFNKGDLIVFSLSREPGDGDACLVAVGEREALFRTVLSLGAGRWRLQPANAKFAHQVVKEGKGLRMWPAIGRWQMLLPRRRG